LIQGAHEVELTGVEREVVQVACSQLRSREQTPSTANVREVVQVAWLLCVRVLAQASDHDVGGRRSSD